MRSIVCLLALVVMLAACGRGGGDPEGEEGAMRTGTFWKDRPSIALMPEFQAVAGGARSADRVEFFEGLPHPMGSSVESFQHELKTKRTIEIHGRHFYEQPLSLDPQDFEPLRAACSNPESFRAWSGHKLCGGFHPDYALRWKKDDRTYDFLFCFGCGEARLYLGQTQALEVDLSSRTFIPLLEKYRAQRPPHAAFPQ